jgi:phage tail sheath protein FI
MILLRRLALREGPQYVFQPNDASFRRAVARQFQTLLSGLFVSGAFAGSSTSQAFQVVTDSSVNAQQSVDLGRLIVELRVAPSRPMSFLIVRLVQQESQQRCRRAPSSAP